MDALDYLKLEGFLFLFLFIKSKLYQVSPTHLQGRPGQAWQQHRVITGNKQKNRTRVKHFHTYNMDFHHSFEVVQWYNILMF